MSAPLMNSKTSFGWTTIALHWLVALAVFGLFGLGYYMVDLTYYDDWYYSAPHCMKVWVCYLLQLLSSNFFCVWPASRPVRWRATKSGSESVRRLRIG